MRYKHFGEFVAGFSAAGQKDALVARPSLKIERTSYAGLQQRAYGMAAWLQEQRVKTGDRVLVVAPNSPTWVELFLGAQLLGAIIVAVDAQNGLETVQTFIKQTTPKLVIRGQAVLTELEGALVLEDIPVALAPRPTIKLAGTEAAVIVFTSGTTAEPKGVVLTQQNILADIENTRAVFPVKARWRFLSVLPLSHMYELTVGCLLVLYSRASVYYLPRVTPRAIGQALVDYQINVILAVPQLATIMLDKIKQTAAETGQGAMLTTAFKVARWLPLPLRRILFGKVHHQLGGHLEVMATGGAPIPETVGRSWELMGVKAIQGYGLTETSPILTLNTLKQRRLDSAGRVIPGVELRIAEDGEIQAAGPSVFAGYWHNPEATKAAFTEDGFFRTGDIGRLDHGWLKISGRAKFTIVLSSGLKVMPEDVELVTSEYPLFKELCVVGVKRTEGEVVEAVLVSDASDKQIETTIKQVNGQLESYQQITGWVRWPEEKLPRNRLLKVDRKAVLAWANSQRANVEPTVSVPVEDPLFGLIGTIVGRPHLKAKQTATLAKLGLDSLRRMVLVAQLEDRLGVAVAESSILPTTTVAELQKVIAQGSAVMAEPEPVRWQYRPLWRGLGNLCREVLIWPLARWWVRPRVVGQQHVRNLRGPVLYIFNHLDGFDVPVVVKALPWRLRNRLSVAAATDIFTDYPALAFWGRLVYASCELSRVDPVRPSLKEIARLVDEGWSIALAPEGKISLDGQLQPFKSGVGLLAVELGIPVVPIKTEGLWGMLPLDRGWPQKKSRVSVKIGAPVSFDASANYATVTAQLEKRMREL